VLSNSFSFFIRARNGIVDSEDVLRVN
jgi:hypothetical protein